jgi:hypothetical protein
MDGLTLASLVPVGALLPGSIVTFFVGLGAGGLAQRELDRLLRMLAVRRAVQATAKAMQAGEPVTLPRDPTECIRGGQQEGIPGMPYRRAG